MQAPSLEECRAAADLFSSGRLAETHAAGLALIERFPGHFFGWQVLATALHAQNRIAEALDAIQSAHRLAPENGSVLNTLGVLQKLTGQLAAAETSFLQATKLFPNHDKAFSNLGTVYLHTGRLVMAEDAFRTATQLAPSSAEAHNNLGVALRDRGHLRQAELEFSEALRLAPGYADAVCNLGVVYRETGELTEAVAAYEKAIALQPDNWTSFSNLLFVQNFLTSTTPEAALELARRYGSSVAATVAQRFAFSDRNRHQRLRVGFVSGDLRDHVVSYFLEGLLANIDRERFVLHAYPTSAFTDEYTARLSRYFAQWCPIYGMDDDTAAQRIHDDAIDILIDLSGHTAYNRLPVFARKPAPLQISWLGYFATTGLAEIDFVFADPISVPEDHYKHFVEKVWSLPSTRLLFTPPINAPDESPLPALRNGYVTFGTFQSFSKIHDSVLRVWAAILTRMPNSVLRLQCRQFTDSSTLELARQRLRQAGISLDRVTMHAPVPRDRYLLAHAEIDMILDTFPFPGGTTTCEALWMGVPTLTLCGDRMISRQGASLMAAAGLPEWVAHNPADYISRAIDFAHNIEGLTALRSAMRTRVAASPLCNAGRFARDFEQALEEVWSRSLSE